MRLHFQQYQAQGDRSQPQNGHGEPLIGTHQDHHCHVGTIREIVHHVCSITDDFCYLLNSELVCNWYVNSIHCAVEDASIDNYAG